MATLLRALVQFVQKCYNIEVEKSEHKKVTNILLSCLKGLFLAVQLVTSAMLIVSIINTNVVPGLILGIIVVALITLLGYSTYWLLFRKKASIGAQITWAVVSAIVIGVCFFAMRFTGAFNGFLNKITEQKPEIVEYSVSVMNTGAVNNLSELQNKCIGFLKTDAKATKAEAELQKQIGFKADYYDNLNVMADVLSKDIASAIVLETDRIEVIKEETESALKDTRVIYTFEVEISGGNMVASEKNIMEEPFILYISGVDSRSGLQTVSLSDVNILAVVDAKAKKILLASVPRDTYVQLHNTTGLRDKLTHAGWYGINMSKETIEDFLDIDIDRTLKVSFDTVVKVVDQLDGIEIYSDTSMSLGASNGKKCNYVVGKQQVDGDCALRFARERKSYGTGDKHRGANQQEVITAIVNKLSSSKEYLLKLPEILSIAADSFETTMSRDEISAFIKMQLDDMSGWKVESVAVDGVGDMEPTYSMGEDLPLYVMIADMDSVKYVQDKINEYLKTKGKEETK